MCMLNPFLSRLHPLVFSDSQLVLREGDFSRIIWLLQIDPEAQTIEPLAINPTDHFADFVSAGDDRLVYAWTGDDLREFVAVLVVDPDGPEHDGTRTEAVFKLPEEVRWIFTLDTSCSP